MVATLMKEDKYTLLTSINIRGIHVANLLSKLARKKVVGGRTRPQSEAALAREACRGDSQ